MSVGAIEGLGDNLLTMQLAASGAFLEGPSVAGSLSVDGWLKGRLVVKMGRTATTALTGDPKFMLEGSGVAAGGSNPESQWFPLWNTFRSFDSALDLVAAESEAVTGSSGTPPAHTVITCASTSNLTNGEFISIYNSGTPANSEIRRILALVANTSITVDGLVNSPSGLTMYDNAQIVCYDVDLSDVERVRLLVDCAGVGTSVLLNAFMNELRAVG